MKWFLAFGCCCLLLSCGSKDKKVSKAQTHTVTTSDSNTAFSKDSSVSLPQNLVMKSPSGIYQFILPYGSINIEHTVSFSGNNYRLQEIYKYPKRDSIVITRGTWAFSDGYIWLYKDQLAEGRYSWKGDTLQYYSPRYQKSFSMKTLTPGQYNTFLTEKMGEGAVFYATGNDVAWTVELDKQDSLAFALPDGSQPVKLKVTNVVKTTDSTVYSAGSNSLSLRVVVFPYFCTDGTGSFVYSKRMQVRYNGKNYVGCGMSFK